MKKYLSLLLLLSISLIKCDTSPEINWWDNDVELNVISEQPDVDWGKAVAILGELARDQERLTPEQRTRCIKVQAHLEEKGVIEKGEFPFTDPES